MHRLGNRSISLFLPAGYPHSVHPHYLPFVLWSFLQSVAGSAASVLSTQSLLYGLGLSSDDGKRGTLALSATLNWVLKDGIGQFGGVLFVAWWGARFDAEAKRFRFLAAILLKLSCLLELLVPLFPNHFVMIASLANIGKNVSWMATSATRAQIHRHLTKADNLGDITGKMASQNTLASLLGTGLGILLSVWLVMPTADFQASPMTLVLRCAMVFLPATLICLYAAYQSCRFAVSPRLSLQRLEMLLSPMLPHVVNLTSMSIRRDSLGELVRYILDPTTIGLREPFIRKNPGHRHLPHLAGIKLNIEPSIAYHYDRIIGAFEREGGIEKKQYLICSSPAACNIWFLSGVGERTVLRGILVASLLRMHLAMVREELSDENERKFLQKAEEMVDELLEPFFLALQTRGWDLNGLLLDVCKPISILVDKQD